MISAHVDDLKGASSEAVRSEICAAIEKTFGKCTFKITTFTHLGIVHDQNAEFHIHTHQQPYIKELKAIKQSPTQTRLPEELVDSIHAVQYPSLLGGLAWCTQTRADIIVFVGYLQRNIKETRNKHVTVLNKILQWIQSHPSTLELNCRVV